MNEYKVKTEVEINELLKKFNNFHDGCIKKISYTKVRDIDIEDGGVVFPDSDLISDKELNIEIELYLTGYSGAKTDQMVALLFNKINTFKMSQNAQFDYADLYEIRFDGSNNKNKLTFYSSGNKYDFLEVEFNELLVIEK